MIETKKKSMTIDLALDDMQSWLDNHPRRSEEEVNSLALAKKILYLFLVHHYSDDTDMSMESSDLDILFGFAFYLSKDSEFGYNRTFLNDKAEAFIKKRKEVRNLFENVINHFNAICLSLDKDLRPYRIQYNDLYIFLYDVHEKRWTARIKNGRIENILEKKVTFQLCQNTKFITTNEVLYTKALLCKPTDEEIVLELKVICGL